MWCKRFFLLVSLVLINGFSVFAQRGKSIINIPVDQPTIQAGIDVAVSGDMVLVAPGTYYENINFNGKDIIVASNFINSSDLSDIESTTIDGSTPQSSEMASCVTFDLGESSSAILQGFTITQGTGSHWIDPQIPEYTWHSGGGILIFQSSPTIKNNIIIDNHVDDDTGVDGASGGGICLYDGYPIITNNVIINNTALYGAGVVIDYSGCDFRNNIVAGNIGGQMYGGGGIWTIGNNALPATIENCTIVNNESLTNGGALCLWGSDITVRNCIIWGNIQATGQFIQLDYGASIDVTYTDVEGGYSGEGNIDELPVFDNDSYVLLNTSPCIDTGNPSTYYNDIEDPLNTGNALFPSRGSLANDMGVYGGQGCLLIEETTISVTDYFQDIENLDFKCFPNPFEDSLEIYYTLNSDSHIEITIYNSLGHIKSNFLDQYQQAGTYSVFWKDADSKGNLVKPGIYFIKMTQNNTNLLKKVVKQN